MIFKKMRTIDYILYSAVIIFGIFIDQLTKLLAVKFLKPIHTKPLIENVLHLTYVENPGAAFGMLAESRWVFLIFSAVAIVALGFYLYSGHAEKRLYAIPISLIISGGIGNMIDRIYLEYVIDFIDFRFINFAVFNGADSFVCVGAGILIFALVRDLIIEAKALKKDKTK